LIGAGRSSSHDKLAIDLKLDEGEIRLEHQRSPFLKEIGMPPILALAEGYGIRTVADGVETTSDFFSVREMGFDLVKGYLFGKPVSAKKFAKTVLSHAI
jgi:EAL domain-containing protein (putative c-di-GMP-specific phosphodiesterase class I)